MDVLIQKILNELYNCYITYGHERRDYNKFIIDNGFDPNSIANEMAKRGLIRQRQPGKGLIAIISIYGIECINPTFFKDKTDIILTHAKANHNCTTIHNAIPTLPEDGGGMARDIAQYIQLHNIAIVQKLNSVFLK